MQSIRLAYTKCYQCIKEGVDAGAGAEKDTIEFGKYSICLCEKHLNQVVGKMFEHIQPTVDVLEQIRGEIIEKYWDCDICKWKKDYKPYYNIRGDINDILQIIDKYTN